MAVVHSVSTDSSTPSAPTAATRLTTAQGLVKWPSSSVPLTPIFFALPLAGSLLGGSKAIAATARPRQRAITCDYRIFSSRPPFFGCCVGPSAIVPTSSLSGQSGCQRSWRLIEVSGKWSGCRLGDVAVSACVLAVISYAVVNFSSVHAPIVSFDGDVRQQHRCEILARQRVSIVYSRFGDGNATAYSFGVISGKKRLEPVCKICCATCCATLPCFTPAHSTSRRLTSDSFVAIKTYVSITCDVWRSCQTPWIGK